MSQFSSSITFANIFLKSSSYVSKTSPQNMLQYECYAANQITGVGLEHKFVFALQLFGYGC